MPPGEGRVPRPAPAGLRIRQWRQYPPSCSTTNRQPRRNVGAQRCGAASTAPWARPPPFAARGCHPGPSAARRLPGASAKTRSPARTPSQLGYNANRPVVYQKRSMQFGLSSGLGSAGRARDHMQYATAGIRQDNRLGPTCQEPIFPTQSATMHVDDSPEDANRQGGTESPTSPAAGASIRRQHPHGRQAQGFPGVGPCGSPASACSASDRKQPRLRHPQSFVNPAATWA